MRNFVRIYLGVLFAACLVCGVMIVRLLRARARLVTLRTQLQSLQKLSSSGATPPESLSVAYVYPKDFTEAQQLVALIRTNQVVVVDLTETRTDHQQRITDYICGMCLAMNFETKLLSSLKFLAAPREMRIAEHFNMDFLKSGDNLFTSAVQSR